MGSEVKLDPQQLQAVEHEKGPCMVAAVAGSGKTTAIVYRIKRLIEKGVPPHSILATTFTRRAAREMNERLTSIGVREVKVGTFHSVCYSILREDGKKFGGKWRVRGELPLNKSMCKTLGLPSSDSGGYEPSVIVGYIGWCKNWLLSPKDAKLLPEPILTYTRLAQLSKTDVRKLAKSYRVVERYRKQAHFLTYDDILYQCHRLFVKNRDVLKKWRMKYRFIIVDEVQDNCYAQHQILKLLAYPRNNVMIVGDLAQSIYSWRAASPQFMISFPQEFSSEGNEAKVVKIENNYRSRPEITDVANRFMTHAEESLGTVINPSRPRGGQVFFNTYRNAGEEAQMISMDIRNRIALGEEPASFAIICRVNRMMEDFQIAMTRLSIPFKVIGGMSLYEYRIAQDLLAYLQYANGLTKGVDDKDAYYRIMNTPSRGLGDQFMSKVMVEASTSKTPVYEIAASFGAKGAVSLAKMLNGLKKMVKRKGPDEVIRHVLDKTGYVDRFGRDNEKYHKFLADKSTSLCMAASQFRRTSKFLHHVEEVMLSGGEEEEIDEHEKDKVIIITGHRAKGLEFKHVYIPQMTSDRFPHLRSVKSGMIEEEKRLFYVAMTRAKDTLKVSSSLDKYPSEFIDMAGLVSAGAAPAWWWN